MNTTMNSTYQCQISTPQQPHTNSNWCALPVGTNSTLSSLLQTCCRAPVAYYAYVGEVQNCWQYCNLTETSTFNNQSVMQCLTADRAGIAGLSIVCGKPQVSFANGRNYEPVNKLPWMVLGIVTAGVLGGFDLA
jgi:hypothetical protein